MRLRELIGELIDLIADARRHHPRAQDQHADDQEQDDEQRPTNRQARHARDELRQAP